MLGDKSILRNKNHNIIFRFWLHIRKYFSKFSRPRLNEEIHRNLDEIDFTLFSNNCLGGVFYHDAGRQFTSPTVNLAFDGEDFIKFLENPFKYYKRCFSYGFIFRWFLINMYYWTTAWDIF